MSSSLIDMISKRSKVTSIRSYVLQKGDYDTTDKSSNEITKIVESHMYLFGFDHVDYVTWWNDSTNNFNPRDPLRPW